MNNMSPELKKYICLIVLSILSLYPVLHSQEIIDFPPDDGGTMIGDILHTNNMIYTYSSDKIIVYNALNENKIGEVLFNEWGKFNPFFFNPKMWIGEFNIMETNTTTGYVYAFSPDLKLYVMTGASKLASLDLDIGPGQYLSDTMLSQHGRVIMKYDPTSGNERLYVLLDSKDPSGTGNINYPGCFHQRKTYFGIYKVNNSISPGVPGYLTLLHNEIIDFDEENDYGDQINNFEFNTANQNYFYLTRLDKFEIWEISSAGVVGNEPLHTEEVEETYYGNDPNDFYKFGKMLNVNTGQNGLHKIIITPYRYPNANISDVKGVVYVINGDHTSTILPNDIKEIDAPSRRVIDICFHESRKELILSYSPNDDIQSPADAGTDVSIYSYNTATDEFGFVESCTTNQSNNTSIYDENYSIHLTKVENGSEDILVCKKDQVVKLFYNSTIAKYDNTQLLEAENNIFKKGISGSSKTYIINSSLGKLEIFNNSDFSHSSKKTGHPIHHITSTPTGDNMLYYNKLNVNNTGVYSIRGESVNYISLDNPIGGCIYNPHQNHFLISQFTGNEAEILVMNPENNSFLDPIIIPNKEYAKELFIAPDGKLYIMTNMIDPSTPIVMIYDFDEEVGNNGQYVPFSTPVTISGLSCSEPYLYYTTQFDSRWTGDNPDVFITIRPHDLKEPPYNSETNYKYAEGPEGNYDNSGKFVHLNNGLQKSIPIKFPNKINCPVKIINGNDSQYENLVFISGKILSVYNVSTQVLINQFPTVYYAFIDIIYDENNDQLFALRNIAVDEEDENRICTIWDIDFDSQLNTFVAEQTNLAPIPGQAAAFFVNPYDGRVYLHRKIDNEKLGDVQVSLHSFDPSEAEPYWSNLDLGLISYAPEYDQTSDPIRSNYYNLTTPFIDPFVNKIYLPNGGHSNVSVVNFDAFETLNITEGTNWISIPRHKGNLGTQTDESYPTKNVFDKITSFQTPYNKLILEHNKTGLTYEDLINAKYNYGIPYDWEFEDDMDDTYSYRGYKLNLEPSQSNTLFLNGYLEDPNTYITLYPDAKKNWVGYFIKEEQDVLDALADVLDDIYVIKNKDYFCYFGDVMDGPSSAQPPVPTHNWHCNTIAHNIKYGQMVEIWAKTQLDFTWNYSGNPPLKTTTGGPEYFTFTEQADYDMLMVELDTTENPVEIGAFVNDSCVGASLVGVNDTVVGMQIYDEGIAGDITFEQYFGTKSSESETIRKYSVYDKNNRKSIKQSLHSQELDGHAFVSLRSDEGVHSSSDRDIGLNCYPNPTSELLTINYTVNRKSDIKLDVINSVGQTVAILVNGFQMEGSNMTTWELEASDGTKLNTGLYSVRLMTCNNMIIKKIIILSK